MVRLLPCFNLAIWTTGVISLEGNRRPGAFGISVHRETTRCICSPWALSVGKTSLDPRGLGSFSLPTQPRPQRRMQSFVIRSHPPVRTAVNGDLGPYGPLLDPPRRFKGDLWMRDQGDMVLPQNMPYKYVHAPQVTPITWWEKETEPIRMHRRPISIISHRKDGWRGNGTGASAPSISSGNYARVALERTWRSKSRHSTCNLCASQWEARCEGLTEVRQSHGRRIAHSLRFLVVPEKWARVVFRDG